jgi:hypothetical protein
MIIQFSIQLTITRTMHCSLGLIFNHSSFDSTNVTKHGLSYTALSRVNSKENLYLLCLLLNKIF